MICLSVPESQPEALLDPTVLFVGGYTVLGLGTVIAALILLRGREAHQAVSMVCLYVCTIITGGRIWQLWFSINTSQPGFFYPGLYWLNSDAMAHVKTTALWVAWPFLSLAGHCFICASGSLVRWWSTLRSRIAVILCGMTLCTGLLCPLFMLHLWHDWIAGPVQRAADTCNETRHLTDDQTAQLTKEYPDDWRVLLIRANYLYDVGRTKEARAVDSGVLRLLASDMPTIREKIMQDRKRAAESTIL